MQYQKSNTTFLSGCVRYVEVISFAEKECLKCGFYCLLEYFGAYPMWPLVYTTYSAFSHLLSSYEWTLYKCVSEYQHSTKKIPA